MSDVIITLEEQKAIRSLERLVKKWPDSLSLFGWAGTLCVMKTGKDGRMCDIPADTQLLEYFSTNKERIEGWFNMISPAKGNLKKLRAEIQTLHKKQWSTILK